MRKGSFSIDDGNGKQQKIKNLIGWIRKNVIVLHVRHAFQNEEKANIFVWKRNNGGITAIEAMTRTLACNGIS